MYQMRLITHRLPLRAPPLPYHHHRYLINTYLWHSLVQSIQFRLFFIQFNDRVNNLDYHLLIWILLKTWTKKASIRGRAVYIVIVPAAVWSLLWFIDLVFFFVDYYFCVAHTQNRKWADANGFWQSTWSLFSLVRCNRLSSPLRVAVHVDAIGFTYPPIYIYLYTALFFRSIPPISMPSRSSRQCVLCTSTL